MRTKYHYKNKQKKNKTQKKKNGQRSVASRTVATKGGTEETNCYEKLIGCKYNK